MPATSPKPRLLHDGSSVTGTDRDLALPGKRAPRIVLMTTSPSSLYTFFESQVRFLRTAGFRIHTVSAPAQESSHPRWRVPMHAIPMLRKISPFADLKALIRLTLLFRRIRPFLVHTHTPKAGLLGMIAARSAGIPVRIYTVNGLVWATQHGWRRRLLQITERLSCRLATEVVAVSSSLLQLIVHHGICPSRKIRVLGLGGSHGVDIERFDPAGTVESGRALRRLLDIPPGAQVILFVGRLVREKGIEELAVAWPSLRSSFPDAFLVLCGDEEKRDAVRPEILAELRKCPRVRFSRAAPNEVQAYYAACDLCILPTWREGLPNVALESAAMRKPIIATRVTGCVDAIQDGVTGLLVEPRDPDALINAIHRLLSSPVLRQQMGENGRKFITEHFSEKVVSARLAGEYHRLLAATGSDRGRAETATPPA